MHPTITQMIDVVAKGESDKIAPLLAEDVTFMPPTYYKTWTGRAPVAAVLLAMSLATLNTAGSWGKAQIGRWSFNARSGIWIPLASI